MKRVDREGLDRMFEALSRRGYEIVGPTLRDGAIIYDEIRSTRDLPSGWTDIQDGGHYRLERRGDDALFGYAVGPHSWKKYLFPPEARLWQIRRREGGFATSAAPEEPPARAFIGVRSCEIHAIDIQDRIFIRDIATDPVYATRREKVFIVAVQCGQAGGTCFCVSMETGPRATFGFDLALTEIQGGASHYYVIEAGSDEGREVLDEIPHRDADESERRAADSTIEKTARSMGRHMDTTGIKELLYQNQEHPRWDDVASRCLSCTNCTIVCPTCFCSTTEDVSDLAGEQAERWRRWDSCFTLDHSRLHGQPVRDTIRARYRQWLTHKVASWIDQFGTSGCVGCGRCITWCPVGIDITEEVRALRGGDE